MTILYLAASVSTYIINMLTNECGHCTINIYLFLGDFACSEVTRLWVREVQPGDRSSRIHGQRLGKFDVDFVRP